jgi:hypothetical protein
MQSLIEELIRWFGHYTLRLITWGRYTGGREADRLIEGAIGLIVIAAASYVFYAFAQRIAS